MPLAALRGLVVLAFVVPVSLGVLVRSADANSFDAMVRDASMAVVAAVDGTIASASGALMQPAAAGDGFWEWFVGLFGGGEETQATIEEEPIELPAQVAVPTPTPVSTPAPRIATTTPVAAPRPTAIPTSVSASTPTKTTERVIERTVVQPTYTTVVLPDPALEKRVSDLEKRPSGGGAVIAIPVFNHEEGNDNTFTDSSINNPSINGGTIVNLAGLAADKSTTTNATSTTFYASLGRFAEAVIDTMTVTATNFATAVITTLTATNATLTNATSTNATSTNLYVSGQTTIGALSGFLKATAGVVSTALVNLASDVTGILPVSSGGTGWSAIASGYIPFGNGSSALATSSVLSFDGTKLLASYASTTSLTSSGSAYFGTAGGNVGIGTTTPGVSLTVAGLIRSWTNFASFEQIAANGSGFRWALDGSNNLLLQGTTNTFSTVSVTPISVLTGGNVGIGTSGPVAPLNVNFAGGDEDGVVRIDATTRPSLTFVNTGVQAWAQYIDTADSNKFKIGPANSGVSNTSAALTMTTGGNVGIGTTTPQRALSVVAAASPTPLALDGNGTSLIHFTTGGGTTRGFFGYSPNGTGGLTFRDSTGNTDLVIVTNAGNVGINTTAPPTYGGYTTLAINNATNGGLIDFLTNGTRKAQIFSNSTQLGIFADSGVSLLLYAGGANYSSIGTNGDFSWSQTNSSGGNTTLCWDGSGASVWGSCTSLRAYKESIQDLDMNLTTVMALRPVSFNWKNSGTADIGFIAEEVELVSPLLAEYGGEGGALSGVKYNVMGVLLVKALQEVAAVTGVFRQNLSAWFADAGNGIGDFFANRVRTKELCVGEPGSETCVTKTQLDALLSSGGTAPAAPPPEEPPAEEPTPEEPPAEEPPAEEPALTPVDEVII